MIVWQLSWRLLWTSYQLRQKSFWFALLGLSLGVACLVVSMSVMGGFEKTLKKAMTDVTGHLIVVPRHMENENSQGLAQKIQSLTTEYQDSMAFLNIEALTATADGVRGVLLQGVDSSKISSVLSLKSRLIDGSLNLDAGLSSVSKNIPVVIGKGLAEQQSLSLQSVFKVILPVADSYQALGFRRKIIHLQVQGILDAGKHDWNQKMIVMDLRQLQSVLDTSVATEGLIVKIKNVDAATSVRKDLIEKLGAGYFITDWREINQNLFEAVAIEKPTIFFIVLILVIVAAFNISSYLFVMILKRYPDIAILKTLGLGPNKVKLLFWLQGIMVGGLGTFMGFVIGGLFTYLFLYLQKNWSIVAGSVYHIDRIDTSLQLADSLMIMAMTLTISGIAALAPAYKGAHLNPVQGLRYDG